MGKVFYWRIGLALATIRQKKEMPGLAQLTVASSDGKLDLSPEIGHNDRTNHSATVLRDPGYV
jgi:hypothetical protein